MNAAKRPLLRYHGGKWRLAPWIISHFPEHRIYCEPYGGGASVLLRKERCYCEVYNDLDGELVNLFRVMRDDGERLLEALRLTPFSRDEFVKSYETSECSIEQSRRTVVRSFMGFGSNAHNKITGFRGKSHRSGTTPAQDWANYPKAALHLVERLQGVVIENRDAIEVMRYHDSEETLHYVDPPYLPAVRDSGTDYRHEMTEADHVAMGELLQSLKGTVVVSGYPSELYSQMFAGWDCVTREALADGARKRTEVLYINRSGAYTHFFGLSKL